MLDASLRSFQTQRRRSLGSISMPNWSIFQPKESMTPQSSLKNMGVSSLREAYFVFAVGLLLSLNSGYINGLCLSGLLTEEGSRKQSVSAFTGTYTKSGLALANGEVQLFGFEFTLILAFICGAMIAGLFNPKVSHRVVICKRKTTLLLTKLTHFFSRTGYSTQARARIWPDFSLWEFVHGSSRDILYAPSRRDGSVLLCSNGQWYPKRHDKYVLRQPYPNNTPYWNIY